MGGLGSGRHRKPIFQHIIEGTYRRDRHGPIPSLEEIEKLVTSIKPSRWLPPAAKCYFRELAPHLIRLGALDRLNLSLFEGLCVTLAHIDEARGILNTEGEVVNGKLHPLSRVYTQYVDQALQLFRIFGMTPASRSKLGLTIERSGES